MNLDLLPSNVEVYGAAVQSNSVSGYECEWLLSAWGKRETDYRMVLQIAM